MASDFLIDANLLLYAVDRSDLRKWRQASALLDTLRSGFQAAVSTQTLAEFYNAATRRLADPLSPHVALHTTLSYAETFTVCEVTLPIVLEVARAAAEHQMSYWDAQVWATAKLNQIPFVLSEDLQGWESLEGVRFLNPFADDFDLSAVVRVR